MSGGADTRRMLVSGLTGRAKVANGTYLVVAGEEQHRRPVYMQTGLGMGRVPSRLVYDKTHGEPPAWMVELPNDPGKAYAYCEDRAKTPDDARAVWQVWHCALTTPIEHGEWRAQPNFRVVAVDQYPGPARPKPPEPRPTVADARPVSRVQVPAGISISNHRYAEYNGRYAHAGECEGYPYYSSPTGKHLFRPVGHVPALEQWLLSSVLKPYENVCESYIECADATPPVGRRRWSTWDTALNRWAFDYLELAEDHVARLGSSARERQQVEEFARSIRIDPEAEPQLMEIAKQGYRAPLPAGWRREEDRITGQMRYVEELVGRAPREYDRHPHAEVYEDMAEKARSQSSGPTLGFNRTNSTRPTTTTAVAGQSGGVDNGLSRSVSAGLVDGDWDSGAGDQEALARSLSLESQVEDDRRREDRRRLAAEDAVAMGFDRELVVSVQAHGKYDSVDSLVEKLAEVTRDHTHPEPAREDDSMDDAVYDSACALDLNFAGLPNPSNYCFLNATVQCLRHTPGFANMLSLGVGDKGGSKFRGRPATLLEAFVLLLRRMEDGQQRPVRAKSREWEDFIAQCKEQLPSEPDEDGRLTTLVHLKRQPQQDAGEFLLQLLDQLAQDRVGGSAKSRLVLERRDSLPVIALDSSYGDEMGARLTRAKSSPEAERRLLDEYIEKQWRATKDTTRRTKLGALFQGQELTYKLCQNPRCGLFSPSSADPVLVEELHCSHLARRDRATLEELLQSSSEAETPEDFACDRCKSKGTTTMKRVLVKLPQVLVIRLNRALPDDRRVDCSIEFPEMLDMSQRLLATDRTAAGRKCVSYTGRQCQPKYRLFAAVFHEGRSVRSGHYIAYVRSAMRSRAGGSTGAENIWVCCDDDEIHYRDIRGGALSPQREEKDRVGGRATMLFYEREKAFGI